MSCSETHRFQTQTRTPCDASAPYGDLKSAVERSRDFLPVHPALIYTRYEEQMELLKKSHSREMAKLKRSSMEGSDGMKTEVVQLQVEMENMSQKYMEEIEKLKVCAWMICQFTDPSPQSNRKQKRETLL